MSLLSPTPRAHEVIVVLAILIVCLGLVGIVGWLMTRSAHMGTIVTRPSRGWFPLVFLAVALIVAATITAVMWAGS